MNATVTRRGVELVNTIAGMDVTVWSSEAHPRFRLAIKSAHEILDQVIEEIEKVENPYDETDEASYGLWLHVGFEVGRQKILTLLRGGAMT